MNMAQPLPAEEIESPPHQICPPSRTAFSALPTPRSSGDLALAAAWQQHGSSIAEDNWLVVYLPSFEKYMVKKCG